MRYLVVALMAVATIGCGASGVPSENETVPHPSSQDIQQFQCKKTVTQFCVWDDATNMFVWCAETPTSCGTCAQRMNDGKTCG